MNEELLRQVENSFNSFSALSNPVAAGGWQKNTPHRFALALYTEFYWSVNARSLMNFLMLRSDPHAQWEIQQYAQSLTNGFLPHKCMDARNIL
jgi:thymidylate synthase (FAD)